MKKNKNVFYDFLYGKSWKSILPPDDSFDWLPFPIQRRGNVFRPGIGWNIESYQPTGKEYYVDILSGNDANDGDNPSLPLKSVFQALNKEDADVVLIKGGIYPFDNGWNTSTVSRSMSIKSWDGEKVILSPYAVGYSWTVHGTYSNVYFRVTGNIKDVFDKKFLDENDEYYHLTLVGSVLEVSQTPGSYFIAGSVYIRLSDDRVPDSDVLLFIDTASNAVITGGVTVYMENIHLEGGTSALTAFTSGSLTTQVPLVVAKDCSFKYATTNGVSILGGYMISQNCVASKNRDDGFNYHSRDGFYPKAIEINNIGRNDGFASDTDNGSTIHDGGRIIRMNGIYYGNKGRNIHDVSNGTRSWNMGCICYNSTSVPANCNYGVGTGVSDTARMWLDCCQSYDSDTDVEINNGSYCYIRCFMGNEIYIGVPMLY